MANEKTTKVVREGGAGGAMYFLGFVGAAVYFIQTASGFWDGVLGVLQAIVWPAFLIYELFRLVE